LLPPTPTPASLSLYLTHVLIQGLKHPAPAARRDQHTTLSYLAASGIPLPPSYYLLKASLLSGAARAAAIAEGLGRHPEDGRLGEARSSGVVPEHTPGLLGGPGTGGGGEAGMCAEEVVGEAAAEPAASPAPARRQTRSSRRGLSRPASPAEAPPPAPDTPVVSPSEGSEGRESGGDSDTVELAPREEPAGDGEDTVELGGEDAAAPGGPDAMSLADAASPGGGAMEQSFGSCGSADMLTQDSGADMLTQDSGADALTRDSSLTGQDFTGNVTENLTANTAATDQSDCAPPPLGGGLSDDDGDEADSCVVSLKARPAATPRRLPLSTPAKGAGGGEDTFDEARPLAAATPLPSLNTSMAAMSARSRRRMSIRRRLAANETATPRARPDADTSVGSASTLALASRIRPAALGATELGGAARVKPGGADSLSPSGGAPKPKITKSDLSYMMSWDPAQKPKRAAAAPEVRKAKSGAVTVAMAKIEEDDSNGSEASGAGAMPPTPPRRKRPPTPPRAKARAAAPSPPPAAAAAANAAPPPAGGPYEPAFLPLASSSNLCHINSNPYAKLGVIGRGGSCKVYRALGKDLNVVALKRVKLDGMDKKAIDG
ncbi:hypothetical protein TeGR_g3594, partial [Tetraparma gracilis]